MQHKINKYLWMKKKSTYTCKEEGLLLHNTVVKALSYDISRKVSLTWVIINPS